MNETQIRLNQYYECSGIAHVDSDLCFEDRFEAFGCTKKSECREACREKKIDADFSPPTDGVSISRYYENRDFHGYSIPRILVLSLSPPEPKKKPENGEPSKESLNPHWRETLAMVRSILHCHVPTDILPGPARRWNDGNVKEIESLFVHVRAAKCCSNANGKRQEPPRIYKNCGEYLRKELQILEPDVIITQGNSAHVVAAENAFHSVNPVSDIEGIDPQRNVANIAHLRLDRDAQTGDDHTVFWLKSYHPSYYGGFYHQAGEKIEDERNEKGSAKRWNFVRYGEEIREFVNSRTTYGEY